MKLLSLNIWGGQVLEPLLSLLRRYTPGIDVFCFQEVFNNPDGVVSKVHPEAKQDVYHDLKRALPGYAGFLTPYNEHEGLLAMFIRKERAPLSTDSIVVYQSDTVLPGWDCLPRTVILQYARIPNSNETSCLVGHLHGHHVRENKSDTPARLEQSRNIQRFLDSQGGPKILCGDFNLDLNTESMRMLERGMRNLVKEFNVTTTRSPLYLDRFRMPFADYMLVSHDVSVQRFEVLDEVVSDHRALVLDVQ